MKDLNKRVEEIQALFKKHRRLDLKELPTRTIFIDPLLGSLGWDVRDPDEVELEYPTIDGKSVDYALKINKKVVALVEAKALNDPLDDVKSITQIVGYAANDGVEWCVLTNGIRWKVYSSSQKTTAPNKLLFEVSLIPEEASEQSTEQIASQLARLSRESLAQGVLDQLGEIVFTTAKVRKALDRLFMEPDKLINLVRKNILDDSVSKAQIRFALQRIWPIEGSDKFSKETTTAKLKTAPRKTRGPREQIEYGEEHHTSGKPAEVVELYRALDRICQDFSPEHGHTTRKFFVPAIYNIADCGYGLR